MKINEISSYFWQNKNSVSTCMYIRLKKNSKLMSKLFRRFEIPTCIPNLFFFTLLGHRRFESLFEIPGQRPVRRERVHGGCFFLGAGRGSDSGKISVAGTGVATGESGIVHVVLLIKI